MTRVARAIDPADMTEAQLQSKVIERAYELGWGTTLSARKSMLEEAAGYGIEAPPIDGLVFHPRYSLGSEPGWPDLVLVRRRDKRLVFAEIKSQKRHPSPRQLEVLDLLRWLIVPAELLAPDSPRIQVFVWRPSDLASGAIAEVLR